MRKSLWTAVGLLALSGVLVAQHSNLTETRVKSQLIVVSDVKIGAETLTAGEYLVVCDATTVTFTKRTNDVTRVLKLPCKGKELQKVSETTVMSTDVDRNGVRYVQKLLLRGSNVEHVFD